MNLKRAIWLALIPVVAYFYYQIQFPNTDAAHLSHYALQFTLLLFATLSLASGAIREQRKEVVAFWSRLATGTALWVLATIMESTEVLLAQPRFGTVADGAWVSGYAVILAAMISGANAFKGWKCKRSLLAGGLWLAVSCLVLLVVVFAAMPKVDRTLVLLLGCLYHASDVLLVLLAIVCAFSDVGADLHRPLRLILASFILFYLFDLLVILQQITSPLDQWSGTGYAAGYFLLYRAGMASSPLLNQTPE